METKNSNKNKQNQKKDKTPLVSIVIPVYNGSNYMREAIDSALAQDYPNIEVLVINDGSKDEGITAKIAKSYGRKIRYLEKENGGVSTALNLGIKEMKGEYFSWLSHDDRYYSNKISTQVNYLKDNNLLNKNVITYTDYDIINEKSEVIGETQFKVYRPNDKPELSMLRGLISGTALLIPKKAFEEYGGFDTKYRCIQDYLLFFEFMKTYRYIYIPKTTNSTRIHEGQVTNVNPKVIEENNYLWIKMQEEVDDEVKIRLMHSKYDFYIRMERYLKNNIGDSKNDYVKAREHALEQAETIKESVTKKFAKLFNKEKETEIYNCLYKYYTDCNKFRKVKDTSVGAANPKTMEKVKEIINEMGLYNTIEYAYMNTSDKTKKKNYSVMYNHLKCYYSYYLKSNNKLSKLIIYYKGLGFLKTAKKIIIKLCDKLRLWKIIRIFIPEKTN